ncbi:Laminin-like protein epi-1 [Acropora cervicornis]|uniref:Laminin-like protein epi-1 n=1 Tax=Acropora cervicornis TaxID=6130 RepID=A0AAD9QBE2_ACRCE|nr:Laminin-like protein epi-1 [Acropora cervicornis]
MSLKYVCLLCRVESNSFYAPTLHQCKIELEDALTENDRPAYYRYSESEFSGFSWLGYVVFSQSQTSIHKVIDIPRTSRYQLIFYYKLSRYAPVTALVKFTPTLDSASFPTGPATEQIVDVRFRSTASWILAIARFLVVQDDWGDSQQIMLSQGKWKLTMAAPASDLFVRFGASVRIGLASTPELRLRFSTGVQKLTLASTLGSFDEDAGLDYLVLLPQEYYRPQNLMIQVSKPCTLSRDDKYCLFFTYPSLRQAGFVTIQAEDNSVLGGIRRTQRAGDIPFRGLLLTGSRISCCFCLIFMHSANTIT